MSNPHRPHLPPEILDYIADFLHHTPRTLKECCLVSRSWVPRTRRHLFANINFITLLICCIEAFAAKDAQEGGWLQTFSRVAWVELYIKPWSPEEPDISLVPFYKFSPSVKSLRVATHYFLPCPPIFHLIQSLPLLENLTLNGRNAVEWGLPPTINLSTPPALTRTLRLTVIEGIEAIARRLLNLPDGLHFRKLVLSWYHKEDPRWTEELVAACSDTLEGLDVAFRLSGAIIFQSYHRPMTYVPRFVDDSGPNFIDLSKATKLRDVIFRPESPNIQWITPALQTITSEHQDLRQILIYITHGLALTHVDGNVGEATGEELHRRWLELDCLLVQFWESRSIRPRLMSTTLVRETWRVRNCFEYLLPEMTKRGLNVRGTAAIAPAPVVDRCHQL